MHGRKAPRRRTRARIVLAVAGAALTAFSLLSIPVDEAGSAGADERQVLFGAYPKEHGGETPEEGVTRMETEMGRPLAYVRDFLNWTDPFPQPYHDWLASTGHALYLSVKAKDGTHPILWQDIADATKGTQLYKQIVGWANKVKAYEGHVFFAFNHEPEAKESDAMGDAPNFIAAWRNIWKVFHKKHVDNAEYIWTMTGYAFRLPRDDDRGRFGPRWYPGDKYVDGISADVYNWYDCREASSQIVNPWWTIAQIAGGVRDFAARHPTEKLFLAEWASYIRPSVDDPTGAQDKADWIANAQTELQKPVWNQLAGISYFNTQDGRDKDCKWWVDFPYGGSQVQLDAFTTMANDPFYGAPAPAAVLP